MLVILAGSYGLDKSFPEKNDENNLTTLFSVSILAAMAIAGPGCSGYKEVTLAEQKSCP